MSRRIIVVILSCVLTTYLWAHPHRRKSNAAVADPAYCSALAAANRFLHAWQTQDHEAAIMMLSDTVRQQTSAELLEQFFSPAPDAAYEIAHGKRLNATEYVFPAVLFGASKTSLSPHAGRIILIRNGKDDWAVNSLP
jgi:hypothetical protein